MNSSRFWQLDESAMKWLKKESTMLVGIDVTHPGIGSKGGTPSIAAVVASVDDSFVQFPASIRIQESKKEVVLPLACITFLTDGRWHSDVG